MSSQSQILVADDNEADVETCKRYLADLDCQIDVATDGADTLDRVARFQPNLILLNPRISEIGGFDICRQIKANSATCATMILMVLALNEVDEIERAIDAGVDDFLGTPVNKSELLKRVQNLLKVGRL